MKRRKLLAELAQIAKARGLRLELVRTDGPHDVYQVGRVRFPVPRHREIAEGTARAILKKVKQI